MKRIPSTVRKKAARIKLLLLDVDGVLTDGGIYIDSLGVETKRFDVRDGQGIALLRQAGIQVGLVTGRSSKIVPIRAKELGVNIVYQGVKSKAEAYKSIKQESRLADGFVAYVGDDIADVPILQRAGLAIVVRDASDETRRYADYVTQAQGGRGAVREVCELLLKSQRLWDGLLRPY